MHQSGAAFRLVSLIFALTVVVPTFVPMQAGAQEQALVPTAPALAITR
jgi:hypothetical protein